MRGLGMGGAWKRLRLAWLGAEPPVAPASGPGATRLRASLRRPWAVAARGTPSPPRWGRAGASSPKVGVAGAKRHPRPARRRPSVDQGAPPCGCKRARPLNPTPHGPTADLLPRPQPGQRGVHAPRPSLVLTEPDVVTFSAAWRGFSGARRRSGDASRCDARWAGTPGRSRRGRKRSAGPRRACGRAYGPGGP